MKKTHDFDIGWKSYVQKCVFILSLLCWGTLAPLKSTGQNQEVRLTLKMEKASLPSVFKEITSKTGYEFVYSSDMLANTGKVSINVQNETLAKVLETVLQGTGLGYKIEDKHVIVSPKLQTKEPKEMVTYTGIVKDVTGATLPGVTVLLKGTSIGVVTNDSGKFTIFVPKMAETIFQFSFVGMKSKELAAKENKPLNVTLEEEVNQMDEVVITGIFNKPKESFTGAAVKVTREELKMAGNRNILRSLSNIDPSFMIVENNSQGSNPNALPEIRLRGVSSIPSVDQLQTATRANLTTPLFILDGFEISLERMMDLNNDEIESITILKDASATAIYGSRGSNGVVVITSIKPEKGKLKLSYSGNLNLEIPDLASYNLMNAKEKLQLEYDAGLYNNTIRDQEDLKLKQSYARKLERVSAGVNTDWLSIPTQTGVGQSHSLGVSGGDEAFRYNLGFSYNNIIGAMKGSNRQTVNGNLNISYLQTKFSVTNTMSFGINTSKDSPYGSFGSYAKLNPYWEPKDAEGRVVKQFEQESNALFERPVDNPYWDVTLNSYTKSKYTSITNNTSVMYKPIESLQVNVNFSFNKTFSIGDVFRSPNSVYYFTIPDPLKRGDRTYSRTDASSWAIGFTANYFKTWGKHVLTAGFNYEARENLNESRSLKVFGFVNEEMNSLAMAQSYDGTHPTSSNTKSHSIGMTGTINYNFDNRLYVDGSYRRDGASSFGSDARFAPFWSVGCGWTISNEPWVKDNLGLISNLRVKYSYGVTGAMTFSPWQSQGTYKYNSGTYRGGISATVKGLENKDLKWQNTYQHNVGVDFGFFQNKITLTANYYHKLTDNSITDMALPLSNGFKSYTGNSGEILNTGIDLNLSLYLIRNTAKQFTWSVVFGTAYNKNKLKKLSQAVKDRMMQARAGQSYGLYYVYEEGQSVDAIYAVPTVGVDPSTGRMVYVYLDGTQSYKYDVNQRVVCGDRMPKLDGRLSTAVQWKGLSLNAGFTIRTGGQKYNDTYANKIENVDLTRNVDRRVATERWVKPGDEAIFMGLQERVSYITDRYIQDERTFSCNNINVTYNFQQHWVSALGFSHLSLTASISNVFYWSTVKQERGTGYPYAIQPSFGVSCSF